MTNGAWEARMDAEADYRGEVLAEEAEEYVLEDLPEFVHRNLDGIIEILLDEHLRALVEEMESRGYGVIYPTLVEHEGMNRKGNETKVFCDSCRRNFGNRDRYGVVDEQEGRTVKTVCEICVENLFEGR